MRLSLSSWSSTCFSPLPTSHGSPRGVLRRRFHHRDNHEDKTNHQETVYQMQLLTKPPPGPYAAIKSRRTKELKTYPRRRKRDHTYGELRVLPLAGMPRNSPGRWPSGAWLPWGYGTINEVGKKTIWPNDLTMEDTASSHSPIYIYTSFVRLSTYLWRLASVLLTHIFISLAHWLMKLEMVMRQNKVKRC